MLTMRDLINVVTTMAELVYKHNDKIEHLEIELAKATLAFEITYDKVEALEKKMEDMEHAAEPLKHWKGGPL
jgi:predicted nuclease with TOPRIM domain